MCLNARMPTCLHACIPAFLHTCIPSHLRAWDVLVPVFSSLVSDVARCRRRLIPGRELMVLSEF